MTSEHVSVYVFIGGEIDYRIEIVPGCAECDFVAIRKETPSSCADRLWQATFDAKPKRPAVTAIEKLELAPVSTLAAKLTLAADRLSETSSVIPGWPDHIGSIAQRSDAVPPPTSLRMARH